MLVVPHIGGDPSTSSDYPSHLGHTLSGIRHKVNDQRHDRDVETRVSKGQCHRIALLEHRALDTRARASIGELAVRRVDAIDPSRGAPVQDQLRECTISASDIGPSLSRRGRQPVQESLPNDTAPDAHKAFVGVAVIETNGMCRHRCSLFPPWTGC